MALFSIRARKIHESTFMCEGGEWVRCTVHGSIEKERKRRKKWRKSFNKMLQAAPYAQQKKSSPYCACRKFSFFIFLCLCLFAYSPTHSLTRFVCDKQFAKTYFHRWYRKFMFLFICYVIEKMAINFPFLPTTTQFSPTLS